MKKDLRITLLVLFAVMTAILPSKPALAGPLNMGGNLRNGNFALRTPVTTTAFRNSIQYRDLQRNFSINMQPDRIVSSSMAELARVATINIPVRNLQAYRWLTHVQPLNPIRSLNTVNSIAQLDSEPTCWTSALSLSRFCGSGTSRNNDNRGDNNEGENSDDDDDSKRGVSGCGSGGLTPPPFPPDKLYFIPIDDDDDD
jgi:hypothetical protein